MREGQVNQYNFILVVGQAEMDGSSVNVRTRDNEVQGVKSLSELIAHFQSLVDAFQ